MTNELGDAPIDPEYIDKMKHIAKILDVFFNPNTYGDNRKTGFVLLVFPFGEGEGRCNYISNGADRKDIIMLFREQAKRFEGIK